MLNYAISRRFLLLLILHAPLNFSQINFNYSLMNQEPEAKPQLTYWRKTRVRVTRRNLK
ncbi:MAG TPA: hypothetical protein ACFCUY_16415 [Xenococcaceae cyanobacterium]